MSSNRRIRPDDLESDRNALVAIQALDGYTPINPAYRADALAALNAACAEAQQAEIRAQNALAAARNAAIAAEQTFHGAMLGAKVQVIAQFGDDSDAVASLGMKRKSERKRPVARPAKNGQ
ncbi:MAG TPA: hypothetical protein VF897_25060 [Roseiflexaceae bacterium]